MRGVNVLRQRPQLLKADDGQALVLTAIGLMVLMMMAALGVDVGYLHYQKQQMQKAADAGAIAAATALAYSGNYTAAGLNDVAANGFTNGMGGVTVTINSPPQTAGDPFQNAAGYVEVIVAKAQPTFFMRIANLGLLNVRSRAVANSVGSASGCIYAMDPVDPDSLLVDGNVSLSTTCGIYVDSTSGTGLDKHGNSGMVTVSGPGGGGPIGGVGIGVVGPDYGGRGYSPLPVVNIPPFTDPLGTVPAVSYPAGCSGYHINTTYYHGVYCNGIQLSGNGNYTFMPGTYVILGGGLSVGGTASITGNNVTFYLTKNAQYPNYGGVNFGGNATATLTAPTTGPLTGILFFQDRSVPVGSAPSTFLGSSSSSLTGALYFPTTNVQFKGTPGVASYSPIVAYQIEFKGDSTIKDDFLPNDGSPIPGAILVE